jgi:glutaredoxin-like YruB-family protein
MFTIIRSVAVLILFLAAVPAFGAGGDAPQSPVSPEAVVPQKYPKIVLYSVAWCPHCKEAKEYFTRNNIPFINRDVEIDEAAMKDLTKKYKSQGVPVIVIGNDEKVLKGFDQARFENAVKEVREKK